MNKVIFNTSYLQEPWIYESNRKDTDKATLLCDTLSEGDHSIVPKHNGCNVFSTWQKILAMVINLRFTYG